MIQTQEIYDIKEKRRIESELLHKKFHALFNYLKPNNIISQKNVDDTYFDYASQFLSIKANFEHKNIFSYPETELLIKDKIKYLGKKLLTTDKCLHSNILLEIYYCELQLNQKTSNYTIPYRDQQYLSLLKLFLSEVPDRLRLEHEEIKQVNTLIEEFYIKDRVDIMENPKTTVNSEEEAEIREDKVKRYKYIIGLLLRKQNLLKTRFETFIYTDPIEKIDDEILFYKTKWEREAKRDFCEQYGSPKTIISEEEAIRRLKERIKDYEHVINLLVTKRNLLRIRFETFTYTNPIQKIDDEILIEKIKWFISAKRNYCKQYELRKNIK